MEPASPSERWQTSQKSSLYGQIPTRNLKFEKFLTELFKSKKSAADVKDEIIKYIQALETNYNELIRSLKDAVAQEQKSAKKVQSAETNYRQ